MIDSKSFIKKKSKKYSLWHLSYGLRWMQKLTDIKIRAKSNTVCNTCHNHRHCNEMQSWVMMSRRSHQSTSQRTRDESHWDAPRTVIHSRESKKTLNYVLNSISKLSLYGILWTKFYASFRVQKEYSEYPNKNSFKIMLVTHQQNNNNSHRTRVERHKTRQTRKQQQKL